jgi:prevent-host-death family protein
MKIALMREVRNNFAKYLETAEEEPVFVTKNGKITAVIEYIEDRSI